MSTSLPCRQASYYVPVLKAVYPAIKQISPNALVGMFGMWYESKSYEQQFMQDMYTLGAKTYFDFANFHYYTGGKDPTQSVGDFPSFHDRWQIMHDVMTTNGDGQKPIWVTETGFFTVNGLTNQQIQQYMHYELQDAMQSKAVTKFFWYTINTYNSLYKDVNKDIYPNWPNNSNPTPAFYTYQTFIQQYSLWSTTGTPVPTATLTPTDTPTDTPFPSGTITPIPSPTDFTSPTDTPPVTLTQSPSLTPTPTLGTTTGSIALHFQGIDPQNNTSPNHPQRQINLYFYSSNNFSGQADYTLQLLITFSSTNQNGLFTNASFDLSAIPPGKYNVLTKSPEGSLREVLNATQPVTIIAGQNNVIEPINAQNNTFTTLRMGDLDEDNAITLTDYNILVDCFGEKSTSPACKSHNIFDQTKGLFSDLNDDGVTNGIDYNILLRNFGALGY